MKKLFSPVALAAVGVFLGRAAQADTTLDFSVRPIGQNNNAAILQTFGDSAAVSSDGVTVNGFGTPNINLTWQATGGRWDYYVNGVWQAGQLDSSHVGDRHEIVFTPNATQAGVVIKSFNFHPYYVCAPPGETNCERFTYAVSVLAGTNVVVGPSNITFISESLMVPVSINYTGAPNQALTLRLARIASTLAVGEMEGFGGDIAIDDLVFAQLPETEFSVGPDVLTVSPANGQVSVAPDYLYSATLTNKTTLIVTNSIQLRHNGNLLSPVITQDGSGLTFVNYAAVGLLPAGSTNKYTLSYLDNGTPAKSYTNEVSYIVAGYVNLQLPAPIVLETFESTPEGSLPPGWSSTSLDGLRDLLSEPEFNLTNLDSATYTNWTVVDAARFNSPFDVYSIAYNGGVPDPGSMSDYQRVLTVNPSNVVNGVFLRSLASNHIAFGNSGYRSDVLGQILFLFSPDFNLTGRSNVYLSFHSLWEQNQDSVASVEYSIDMGATWLPAKYLINATDIFTNLDGTVDGLRTLTNIDASGTAYWLDSGGNTNGGYYGAFIGVASNLWGTLGPYISGRIDDNPLESKRVELIQLPLADNQSKVRLRFAHAGTDSWYWGVDNVGLYSLPAAGPLRIQSIVRNGPNVVISWNGGPGIELQKSTSLINPNWQDVPGTLGASSATEPIGSGEAYYRLIQ